ncbi:MAG: DUF1850 domain-containing protein [Treponema sp.]|nr:DUF1850 domain-containing protein [Treponema sp.]
MYVFGFWGGPETRVLEVRNTGSGRLYGRLPLGESGEFAIEFIHSVNQSPVRETFRAGDGGIWLESVRFYSFGAGIQSDLGEGQTLSRDGGAMIISGFNVPLRELNVIVGTVSDHILFINDERINLRERYGRNAQITLRYSGTS